MKQLLWLLLIALPFSSKEQKNNNIKGIDWTEGLTWDQIKQKAKAESKFIFVDAYATWCVPCKKMDKEVYNDEKVGNSTNSKFISVKIQMDESNVDSEEIRAWYPVARSLKNQFSLDGYPTFLFFSPQGELIHRGVGYKNSSDFIDLVKEALTDPITRYNNRLILFKTGKLPYSDMAMLARDAWNGKDKQMAAEIARKYKKEFADKLSDEDAYEKVNLIFIAEFYSEMQLTSKDRYFLFFYKNSHLADSIMNQDNLIKRKMAANVVFGIIQKEEITSKIYKDGKPIIDSKPNWKKIQKSIKNKYGQLYIDKYFPDIEIRFYQVTKDWNNYAKYVNEKITKITPQTGGKLFGGQFGDAWQLNMYAWTLFLGCNDKVILQKGLSWIDKSLELEEREYAIDTKANLLYKIGRIPEAIILEEKAVTLSKNDKSTVETLQKMKSGIPTWPHE